jgi:hypothetical protein
MMISVDRNTMQSDEVKELKSARRLILRCAASEREYFEQQASDCGLPLGTWARLTLLNKPPIPRPPAIHQEKWQELARLQANINQIAKWLNTYGESIPPDLTETLEATRREVVRLRGELI